ncbi:hypothetical protein GN958_ATG07998 [Phytophthora infestans]|uniref:PHD-type domain-containing protein n=1 Tax=Phytophthora infestans TaxID=4787 RepID=A0A8S9UUQ1_PHYIN|nr:hypothetical protein GN958_ATG07998 [Phytophthora infestans]
MCDVCCQWIKGYRYQLERHERSSRCMIEVERTNRRNHMAEQQRQRDAEYRRRRRGSVGGEQERQEFDILGHLLHGGDGAPQVGAHDGGTLQTDEASLDNETLSNDVSTVGDDAPDGKISVPDVDWNWFNTEFADFINDDGAEAVELAVRQLDETVGQSRNETVQQSREAAEEVSVNVSVDDTVVDSVENAMEDTVDCPICYESDNQQELLVCNNCRQSYHRSCVGRLFEHDKRWPTCRTHIELEVEDDKVIIVRHFYARPTCFICGHNYQNEDILQEGPQCPHQCGIQCLRLFNMVSLNESCAAHFKCPACMQPFPVDSLYFGDDYLSDNSSDPADEEYQPSASVSAESLE